MRADHVFASRKSTRWRTLEAEWCEHRDHPLLRTGQNAGPPAAHGQRPPRLWLNGPSYLGLHTAVAELGFSLNEMRALLRLGGPEKASCSEVRNIPAHHLDDIRAKLGDLKTRPLAD